jgi:asparagine synthase (glutamine-hydrolysing)
VCGFAGYKAFHTNNIDDEQLIADISTLLEHRGPDDAAHWKGNNGRTVLIFRRLAIIDTSATGAQPMQDPERTLTLVYNGEIYNYRALRSELQAKGYQFRSTSDTEVLLYAFKAWGIACLERLDGMFAGVIVDHLQQRLYLFRDRIGIKPLYFSLQGETISFASEIKALWRMPWIARRISLRGLSHYLTYLATPAPMTLFEGIYKLPAGFYACVGTDGQAQFTEWYDPLRAVTQETESEYQKKSFCVEKVRTLLEASVQKRMIADVPIGVLLSGGLDSSLLVAMMAHQRFPITTFTVSFENDPHEERGWARKISKKFGADHHELILTEYDALSFFQKMVYHQDEPLGDSVCIPLYFVSKLAHDAGIKVLLLGEGSDELFCGYPMYVDYLLLSRYWQVSQHYIPSFAKQGLFYAARPFYAHQPNRQDLIKSWASGRQLFWGGVRVFSELWKEEIIQAVDVEPFDSVIERIYPGFPQSGDSYAIADYYRSRFYKAWPQGDFFAAMTYIELKHRLPELLLTRTDKMTMATSIEARVPYLDYALVEAALQIPMKYKYRSHETKYVLKKVAEGLLPADIIYRQKVGFSSPITSWFKQGHYFKDHLLALVHQKSYWQDILNKEAIEQLIVKNRQSSVDYSYQLWALHNVLAF